MSTDTGKTSCLLWPFTALWGLVTFILEATGRLVAIILGVILIMLGVGLSLTIIGAILGIPLAIIGFMLLIRGFF